LVFWEFSSSSFAIVKERGAGFVFETNEYPIVRRLPFFIL
jgi:hypothetical protein